MLLFCSRYLPTRFFLPLVLFTLVCARVEGQPNCCESAYEAARNTVNWRFWTSKDRQCAQATAVQAQDGGDWRTMAKCWLVLAYEAVENQRFDTAFAYLNLFQQYVPETDPALTLLHGNAQGLLGYLYDQMGYQKTSVYHYRRAIDIYEKHGGAAAALISEQSNLVKILAQRGKYQEALALGRAAFGRAQGFIGSRAGEMFGLAANNLGYAHQLHMLHYRLDMRPDSMQLVGKRALEFYSENLDLAERLPEAPQLYAITLLNIAGTYLGLEQVDSARIYLEKYLAELPFSPLHAYYYSISAVVYAKTGSFDQALQEITAASRMIELGVLMPDSLGPVNIPMPVSGNWTPRGQLWMNILQNKGVILYLYYQKHPDQVDMLQKSLVAFEQAIEIFNRLQIDLFEDSAMSDMRARLFSAYGSAALAAARMYAATPVSDRIGRDQYWGKAFRYSEQSRNGRLQQGVLNAFEGACNETNSETPYCRDKVFRDKLADARRRNQAKAEQDILEEYRQFQKALETSASFSDRQFFAVRYGNWTTDVQYLQDSLLTPDALFIEYVWSNPQPFALWSTRTQKGLVFLDIKDPAQFWATVERFKQTWLREDNGSIDLALGQQLYDALLRPVFAGLPDSKPLSRLVIVADNVLHAIPFDVLPIPKTLAGNSARNADIPYALYKFTVSYQYSASLWTLQQKQVAGRGKGMAAVGAYVNIADATLCSNDVLNYLGKFTTERLPKITQRLGASPARVFSKATEDLFYQHSATFDLLHMTMHGCLSDDPDESYLSFYPSVAQGFDGRLTASEFYALPQPLRARLAVFASCSTAAQGGDLESGMKGEGILGLHRAVSYAGCLNVVATLNAVVDKYAAVLLQDFYTNLLLKKMPSDAALAEAKRQYLRNGENFPHPKYWANFICIGPAAQY